jgi:hypothetical protein
MLNLPAKKQLILLSFIKLLLLGCVAVFFSLGIPFVISFWFGVANDQIDTVFAILGIVVLAYAAGNYWKAVDKYRSM